MSLYRNASPAVSTPEALRAEAIRSKITEMTNVVLSANAAIRALINGAPDKGELLNELQSEGDDTALDQFLDDIEAALAPLDPIVAAELSNRARLSPKSGGGSVDIG